MYMCNFKPLVQAIYVFTQVHKCILYISACIVGRAMKLSIQALQ